MIQTTVGYATHAILRGCVMCHFLEQNMLTSGVVFVERLFLYYAIGSNRGVGWQLLKVDSVLQNRGAVQQNWWDEHFDSQKIISRSFKRFQMYFTK